MTVKEYADQLGCKPQWVYHLIGKGRLIPKPKKKIAGMDIEWDISPKTTIKPAKVGRPKKDDK